MRDCPDHDRDEAPWMCQCTRERTAELEARVRELTAWIAGAKRALDGGEGVFKVTQGTKEE